MTNWKVQGVRFTVGGVTTPPTRDPEADRARLREIHDTLKAGNVPAAGDLAEAAYKIGLEHPLVLNLLAEKRERDGRYAEALVLLERAQALAPQDVGVRQALGLCLYQLERYRDAETHFSAVIAAMPDFAPAHGALGLTLEARGDLKGADAAYRRAIALQPENAAALGGLASLASRRGAHDEARTLAERVLQFAPGYPDAMMILAQADLAKGDALSAETRLRALLSDDRLRRVERALADGLLGDVLDAQKRPSEAFRAYATCNAALQDAYRPRFGDGRVSDYARAVIAVVDAAPASAWTSAGGAAPGDLKGHVFLMGFPRSGTTLLEQVLAQSPLVTTLEERETLSDAVSEFARRPDDLVRLTQASDGKLDDLRAGYWRRVREEGAVPDGRVFVDKLPLNTLKLPLISKLFPDAKVLFAQRDPRDVVLSCYRRRFGMNALMYSFLSLAETAALYDASMALGQRLGGAFALRTHTVRHEALVEDFDGTAQAVCAFLDLPWTEGMRDFVNGVRDRGVATPSAAQLARGLSTDGIGHWRGYHEALAPILPILQPWVERFGYPAT